MRWMSSFRCRSRRRSLRRASGSHMEKAVGLHRARGLGHRDSRPATARAVTPPRHTSSAGPRRHASDRGSPRPDTPRRWHGRERDRAARRHTRREPPDQRRSKEGPSRRAPHRRRRQAPLIRGALEAAQVGRAATTATPGLTRGGGRRSTTRVVTPACAGPGPQGQLRPATPELERVLRQGAAAGVGGPDLAPGVLERFGGQGAGRQPDFGGRPRAAGGGLGAKSGFAQSEAGRVVR
jgi:hypothetical protein